jgi:hypothetical protein
MADPGSNDPNQNNMGITVGDTTDYSTWDWRKIKVAVTGSVNTDLATAQDKLTGTSSPQSFYDAATAFEITHGNLRDLHMNLTSWKDFLVGTVDPAWTGQAAGTFRGLLEKTLTSVKGHLDPLAGPPTYAESLNKAGDALGKAVHDINQSDAEYAEKVIRRYNGEPAKDVFVHTPGRPGGAVVKQKGPPPWYTYNGTTIVAISHYPDLDHELTEVMRGHMRDLVGSYKSSVTSMPSPAAIPPPNPGANQDQPPPFKFDPIKVDPPKGPKIPKEPPPPDPKALAGPDGAKPGPLDKEQLGPDGQPLGPDGKPLLGDPNLEPPQVVDTPEGPGVVGPDGKTLLDPKTGKPLLGPDGKPLTTDDLPKTGIVPSPGALGLPRTPPPRIRTEPPPRLTAPALKELPKEARPPELANLTSGGPPPKSAKDLQSEGALKSGAKEFGSGEGGRAGGRAGGEGGGEPMPMGGGMGGAGANGERERERTTWLTEDEEIWGIETTIGGGTLGR